MTNSSPPQEIQARHLASLTSGFGQLTPEEGLQRLRQLEASGGGAGQCRLRLQPGFGLRILDAANGQVIESFPARCLRQPVAYEDASRENLLLFSVVQSEDGINGGGSGGGNWEMHIFRLPSSVPASLVAKEMHQMLVTGAAVVSNGGGGGGGGKSEEAAGLLVQVLNRCLEEVEAFALRLNQQQQQQTPGTPRSQRSQRSGRHSPQQPRRQQQQQQSPSPSTQEYVDVFKKLKLALNLLGRLEGRIHQPNAPELVHCLFVPLSLFVQTLGSPDLASRVLSPLLTPAAVALLQHCLTSNESELWYSLGPAWTFHRQRWLEQHQQQQTEVPTFRPRFARDGWQPDLDLELLGQDNGGGAPGLVNGSGSGAAVKVINPVSVAQQYTPYTNGAGASKQQQQQLRQPQPEQQPQPQPQPQPQRPIAQVVPRGQLAPAASATGVTPRGGDASFLRDPAAASGNWDDRQERLRIEAASRGHRVAQVLHDKAGRNHKELTVQRGELLEVLDDSRNWWQLRNCVGEVGHVPYTILRVL